MIAAARPADIFGIELKLKYIEKKLETLLPGLLLHARVVH